MSSLGAARVSNLYPVLRLDAKLGKSPKAANMPTRRVARSGQTRDPGTQVSIAA
jgi:hypothetical protein